MKITPGQRRALWGYARWLRISEEDLRDWALDRVGRRSIRALTSAEASRLIDELMWKWREGVHFWVKDRITSAQANQIALLEKEIGWDDRRALGLARRMYGVDDLSELSRGAASGLIEALKAIGHRRVERKAA